MTIDQPEYTVCAMCKLVFDEQNLPSLFEDGLAYCGNCAYEISMVQESTAA